jgi:hypothetical protein
MGNHGRILFHDLLLSQEVPFCRGNFAFELKHGESMVVWICKAGWKSPWRKGWESVYGSGKAAFKRHVGLVVNAVWQRYHCGGFIGRKISV